MMMISDVQSESMIQILKNIESDLSIILLDFLQKIFLEPHSSLL